MRKFSIFFILLFATTILFAQNDSQLRSGYRGTVELGYQFGTGSLSPDRLKLDFINSYQFNPFFSLGVGTGVRYFFSGDGVLVPVFADFRINLAERFIKNKYLPYFSLGLGYSFDATEGFYGAGLFFNPGVGVKIKVSEKSSVNVGLGYERQKYALTSDTYLAVGAISLNVGISF